MVLLPRLDILLKKSSFSPSLARSGTNAFKIGMPCFSEYRQKSRIDHCLASHQTATDRMAPRINPRLPCTSSIQPFSGVTSWVPSRVVIL